MSRPLPATIIEGSRRWVLETHAAVNQSACKRTAEVQNADISGGEIPGYRLGFHRIVGVSPAMLEVYHSIVKVLDNDATVLVQGETGTGKELVADAIHCCSNRCDQPFIKVNCASIPSTLMEVELFGYEQGAYTGAMRRKPGKFLLAQNGTIFLDEIGELGLELQTKLLRVIETKELDSLGAVNTKHLNVRIVAATNIDLVKACQQGSFRHDLYYRLNVVPISVPPVRDRKTDIPLLAAHFIEKFGQELNVKTHGITRGALELMCSHDWNGNVRELENLIKRVIILHNGKRITARYIKNELDKQIDLSNLPIFKRAAVPSADGQIYRQVIEEVEKVIIKNVLAETNGKIYPACRRLGIVRNTLKKKMKYYGLR